MPLLEVENLHTYFRTEAGIARAVDGISFSIEEGESMALVGESACGKSVTALSILQLVRPPGWHPAGSVRFAGRELMGAGEATLRKIRGNEISMIFQEPMTSLNPVFTVAAQIREPLRLHQGLSSEAADRRGLELLDQMGISSPEVVMWSYPHQLSGGMRQRAMIAMAVACRPRLMIADEPTTALDVTVQAQILDLMRRLQREYGMALILITHDMGIVNQISDRVIVMYSGRLAEEAPREELLRNPRHPYTVKLLDSIPRRARREQRLRVIRGMVRPATEFLKGCRFAERCDFARARCELSAPPLFSQHRPESEGAGRASARRVACFLYDPADPLPRRAGAGDELEPPAEVRPTGRTLLEVRELNTHFPVKKGFFKRVVGYVRAVDGVTLPIREGITLGLVGESGCGKTTLGHSLLRLEPEARGQVIYEGRDVLALPEGQLRPLRRSLQVIFQDPFSSLNPRLLVRDIVGEGLLVHEPELSREERDRRVKEALREVGLSEGTAEQYAHEFSGGQRQRIAVARALVLRPRFMVLDEATSALDVSVQSQLLNLLRDLQARHGLTYLFITHDLGVVEYLAHEVAVMYLGRIVEHGETEQVFRHPAHPYTRTLLEALPSLDVRHEAPPPLLGDVPSPIHQPSGCHFHPRCPVYQGTADTRLQRDCPAVYPPALDVAPGHWTRCHAAIPGA
jgi:oligopeptide/dipeptide ABC transporter ATP-binding protein